MAKKKNIKNILPAARKQKNYPAVPKLKPANDPAKKAPLSITTQMLLAAGIGMITWLFLKECINNQLTNWDDGGYITKNPLIKDLSDNGIKAIFSNEVMGNYHPLTILSYAIEYAIAGLEPFLYHFDSLLLHIVNTLLVYWLIALLTKRPVAAAVASLLFGLHPMHVESVAWAAGRKDVLYALFYLAACIAYVCYIRANANQKWKWYLLVFVLYVCSLLSKPVAVVFPFSLLLIDYWEQRRLNNCLPFLSKLPGNSVVINLEKRNINLVWLLEKIPFFILSLVFGAVSIYSQHQFHALYVMGHYSFIQRVVFGCYALTTYLWKFFIPAGLSCFYPYPEMINGALPLPYYGYILLIAALVIVYLKLLRKYRFAVFGLLFFLVNIILLLQFVQVGGAVIAERYSYIAYIGLFFIVGWLVSALFEPGANKQSGYAVLTAIMAYTLYLGYLSNERCKVWYDSGTLWQDQIEKYPFRTANGYDNLADYYLNKFHSATNPQDKKTDYDSVDYLLNVSIKLDPGFATPYMGLGDIEQATNQLAAAKKNILKALSFNEARYYLVAWQKLATIYAMSQNYDSSAWYCRASLQQNYLQPELHTNYGKIFAITGKPDSAIKEYEIAMAQKPDYYPPYLERGLVLLTKKQFPQALNDFNKAIQISPQSAELYYYRSLCYTQMGNAALAAQDMNKAQSLGFGR